MLVKQTPMPCKSWTVEYSSLPVALQKVLCRRYGVLYLDSLNAWLGTTPLRSRKCSRPRLLPQSIGDATSDTKLMRVNVFAYRAGK